MDHKTLVLGVLSITAVILLVGLVLVNAPPPAFASAGPGLESGDYVIATGQFLPDEHLLYIIDCVAERLIVYRFDIRSRQSFAPVEGVDLAVIRDQASPGTTPGQPQQGSGRRPPRP